MKLQELLLLITIPLSIFACLLMYNIQQHDKGYIGCYNTCSSQGEYFEWDNNGGCRCRGKYLGYTDCITQKKVTTTTTTTTTLQCIRKDEFNVIVMWSCYDGCVTNAKKYNSEDTLFCYNRCRELKTLYII